MTNLMRRPSALLAGLAAVALATVLALGSAPAGAAVPTRTLAAAALQAGTAGWEVVPTPPLRGQTDLTDVVAFGPADAWAVGYVRDQRPGQRTLTLHWDGTQWTRVPSPSRSLDENWLVAVAGSSPTDVWAAGYDLDSARQHRTLLMHWDGKHWTIVPSPNGDGVHSQLNGLAVLSPTDAWAVGSTIHPPFSGRTLVQHWDGTSWTIVPSPNPSERGIGSNLLDIAAASATQLWAVGDYDQGDGVMRTLTERWDGTAWTVVPSPTVREGALLGSVAARSPDQVWAVGWRQQQILQQPLALRWDGARWSTVEAPAFDGGAVFADVAVVGPDDVWVVGGRGSPVRTLTAHWDGSSWAVVPSADPGAIASSLTAVAAIAGTGCLWAVGQYTSDGASQALIERYCSP
ncbi:MAG TPA: hypothetical protein VFA46_12330 [Actinomycetes bacterium]|nr:hypothetical protein [Actinomycetes bacterium]